MKTTIFKIAVILLLSFTLVQNSDAYGHYFYRAPGFYFHPRCERVFVPGHFYINRCGVRVWAGGYYR